MLCQGIVGRRIYVGFCANGRREIWVYLSRRNAGAFVAGGGRDREREEGAVGGIILVCHNSINIQDTNKQTARWDSLNLYK